jgi:hypothetical protein
VRVFIRNTSSRPAIGTRRLNIEGCIHAPGASRDRVCGWMFAESVHTWTVADVASPQNSNAYSMQGPEIECVISLRKKAVQRIIYRKSQRDARPRRAKNCPVALPLASSDPRLTTGESGNCKRKAIAWPGWPSYWLDSGPAQPFGKLSHVELIHFVLQRT